MKKRKPTAGQRIIESARQALAFAKGEDNYGCEVHVADEIDVSLRKLKKQGSKTKWADYRTLGARPASSQRPRSGLLDSNRA
jgi:hypothetical protein